MLSEICERIIGGGPAATPDEAVMLDKECSTESLCEAADRVREKCCGGHLDTCSIINARSGRCSEGIQIACSRCLAPTGSSLLVGMRLRVLIYAIWNYQFVGS